MKNKIALIYNTCGLRNENADLYIQSIESFLNQNFEEYRVVLSSCCNSVECFNKVYKHFKDKISYCYHHEPHTVNITFNKTVQLYVENFGPAESYLYIDSGCSFTTPDHKTEVQINILREIYECYLRNNKSLIYTQTNTDSALNYISKKYKNYSNSVQIKEEDLRIPLGIGINLHCCLFSHDFFIEYDSKLIPDVFSAYCTESVFVYLAAAIFKKWYVMKDYVISHIVSADGPSSGFNRISNKTGNTWNNLLYERDINDLLQDNDAVQSGLGYEELQGILPYNSSIYNSDSLPINKQYAYNMKKYIKKYFYLKKEELNYEKINCTFRK